MTPRLSLVMSVHNDEAHLENALASMFVQDFYDTEFILVDDGSTDRSSEIMADAASTEPRLRVVRQENAGLTRALIRGCELARGEFVARHDADDESMPGRFSAQIGLLEEDPDLAFVSCWSEVMGPRGETLIVHERPAGRGAAMEMLLSREGGPPGHGSVMFRRSAYEAVGGYRAELYYAQDSDLWLRLARVGGLQYVQRVLYRYRVSPASISGRLHPVKVAFADVVTELHEAREAGLPEEEILERAASLPRTLRAGGRQASSADTSYFIANCLRRRGDPRALGYALDALRARPTNLRAWALLPLVAWRAARGGT